MENKTVQKIYILIDILNGLLKAVFTFLLIMILAISVYNLPATADAKNARRYAQITTEQEGATQLSDFNTWTYNNLGGATVYSPYCIRIYSDGGSTWSYLWTTITFKANSYVNYNFHVKAENSNLRTGIRIYNPTTGTDYINQTTTLSGAKTYQGTLKITTQETIRFDLRRNWYGTGYSGGCVWSMSLTYSDYNTGYGVGYQDGYDEGEQDGYTAGNTAGRQEGYQEGYQNGYDEGEQDGYTAGNTAGKQEGYQNGYTEGKQEGYTEGYTKGEQDGYTAGITDGREDGYQSGFDAGYDQGWDSGYQDGYTEGEEDGIDIGYTDGYTEGYTKGEQETTDKITGLVFIKEMLKATQTFLDLQFFDKPKITLGTLVGGILIVELVLWFIKWWK